MKRIALALLLCAALLPSAAQELYENKNIDYRFDNLLAEAEKGNIVAIYALGETYRYGSRYSATYKGEPDYQKAYEYFKKAADYGYPWASWELARMCSVNELDDPDGAEEKRWYEKAFKDFKFYADNGNAEAMAKLADFYHGLYGDEYKDNLKEVYWSLRALEEGEPDGASSIATCFTYGYAVNENPAFSRAWDVRWCIEAAGKGWPVNEYPEFDSLSAAGYTKNDWEFLAASTYVSVPHYATQNEDSIVDAALLAVDLLNQKAEDFAVEMKVYKQDKALAAAATQKTQGSFSTNLIPQAPQQAVAAQPKKKTNWLSAIGRALNVASSAGGGNNFISGLVQGLSSGSVATGAGAAGGVNAAALDVFKYTGTQRQGQTDANGRVIKSEYNAPVSMGQAHYVYYEDGYCLATTATTCVCCYGKKVCPVCQGKGGVYNSYTGIYYPCKACMGTKVCKYCNGTGGQTTSKLWAPGEAEAYRDAMREVESEESSSSSSSSSSGSSSGSGVCPKCGGKGYLPEAYEYAAGSRYAPYHNSGGTQCPICGKSTDHYHYRCLECKRG